jgi:hypothetical protein
MSNQEPDGWCAWHPEHGYASATEDGGIFVAPEQEILTLSNDSPHSRHMRKEGWQIKPVMLISPQERSRLRLIEQGFNKIHRHMLEQADDETLWLDAESVVEHYILQELRKLHQTIEQVSDAITEDKAHE